MTIFFVSCSLSCLLGCKESLLLRGCTVLHAMRPLSKGFSGAQTAEWVSAGEMCQHWWPMAHQDDGQGAVLDVLGGGKEMCCPSGDGGPCCRDSSSESPEYSCVLGRS